MNDTAAQELPALLEACRQWERAEGKPIAQARALRAIARELVPMLQQPGGDDGAETWPAVLEGVRAALAPFELGDPALDGNGMPIAEALARLLAGNADHARHFVRLAAVRDAASIKSSATVRDDPEPSPILWRDDPGSLYADPVVCEGEAAVLAGAGGGGKSWLAIRLAVEAARAAKAGELSGAACGLRVRAAPVVMLSWEMSVKRIDMAAAAMDGDGVACLDRPPPLFPPDRATRTHAESPDWRPVWDAIAREHPALIVLDTGPKAMGGADVKDGAPVISFLQAVERELQAIGGCAALVLCHDTKAMRDAAKVGEDIGAGAVAGSAQWYDSPRGVLHLAKVAGADTRILEAVKASNGRQHWGAVLAPLWKVSAYAGLQLDNSAADGGRIAPGGMTAARKAAAAEAAGEAKRTDPDPDPAPALARRNAPTKGGNPHD